MTDHDFFDLKSQDKTARRLIVILLMTVALCWGLMIWATVKTYYLSAPMRKQFVISDRVDLLMFASLGDRQRNLARSLRAVGFLAL